MALDLRPTLDVALTAFGVAITVTRQQPDDGPIVTTGVWISSLIEEQPIGTDLRRREPRRVLSISRSAVPTLRRGDRVLAPEFDGDTPRLWQVDGLEPSQADEFRAVLIPKSDVLE